MSVLPRNWKLKSDENNAPTNKISKINIFTADEWPTLNESKHVKVKPKIMPSNEPVYDTTDVKCEVIIKPAHHKVPSHVECTRCEYRYKMHVDDINDYHQHVNDGKDKDKFGMCLQCRLYTVLDLHQMIPAQCRKCDKYFWIKPHHLHWKQAVKEYQEHHLINIDELCPCCWREPQFIKVNRAEPMKEAWALASCKSLRKSLIKE